MPKICYILKKFSARSHDLITQANEIIASYSAQGFTLTLRQLYYQFVSRDIIPNNEKSYKNLGSLINDARLAGLIDWEHLEDRTRNVRQNSHWGSPDEIIATAANSFQHDKWDDQTYRPEVWIEKDALVGVIAGICEELDIPYFSCRGYTSASEMWAGAMRLRRHRKNGQIPIVFHLGDHDPSGLDMTRDIQDRLNLFTGSAILMERLALNMDQIRQFNPPPNPAKTTNARFTAYMDKYGEESWELDALEPAVIVGLIRDAVFAVRDVDKWAAAVEREEDAKRYIKAAADNWDDITDHLREQGRI
jgi:hypothetical protein